jgi:hypothetical protein
MLTIRLSKAEWGKAWRAMIEVAPVRLVADDPVYEVLPAHLELLTARGFTYEVVPLPPPAEGGPTLWASQRAAGGRSRRGVSQGLSGGSPGRGARERSLGQWE